MREPLRDSMLENLTDCTSILKIACAVPQPSVLAHPKVKMFVTHNGQNSTSESLVAGKPMLGIPIMDDQYEWARIIHLTGCGDYCLKTATVEEIAAKFESVFETNYENMTAKCEEYRKLLQETSPLEVVMKAVEEEISAEMKRKSCDQANDADPCQE